VQGLAPEAAARGAGLEPRPIICQATRTIMVATDRLVPSAVQSASNVNAADPFNLARFVDAQSGGLHERFVAELRAGCKQTHCMWFVFPQMSGLGSSRQSDFYGITGLDEARAYLAHPLLGPRLHECAETLLALDPSLSASAIFRSPDDLKLRSSLTLFGQAAGPGSIFERLLLKYFAGVADDLTLLMLRVGDARPREPGC
jgi:uncharacterized protein (DUF1810 family)